MLEGLIFLTKRAQRRFNHFKKTEQFIMYSILLSIFYWNSLIFVSTVAVKNRFFSNQPQVGDICFSSLLEQREEFVFSFKLVIQ